MFDFAIEAETLCAIQEMAADITTVSAERIGMEIRRMLVHPNRAAALELLRETGLLPHVLPAVAELNAPEFNETVRILASLREPTLPLALAALLSTQYGVQGTEPKLAGSRLPAPCRVPSGWLPAPSLGRRLRYTNKEIDRTAWLLQQLPVIAQAPQIPWPQLQRILIHDGAPELLALLEAGAGPGDAALAFCRERLAWPPERLNPPPLVDGSDLIQHGLAPGPEFSALLEKIRDAQLAGEIHTRDQALALADRLRREQETLRSSNSRDPNGSPE
jgi:hypothetical protein